MYKSNVSGEKMHNLTFYTDITTSFSNYCLLNVKKYNDVRKNKKVFNRIDPSVYELKDSEEYSNIDFLHELISDNLLLENEDISIDYPCDMNLKYSELFINKTNENIKKYYNKEKYIISLQYLFHNFDSFVEQFNKNKQYMLSNKIIGFGNLCRIMKCDEYTDKVFNYIFNNIQENSKLHFYGLSMRLIKKYVPKLIEKFDISIDSTKWTKAITNELKITNGVCCRKNNRDLYFLTYMNELKKLGIDVIF